MTLLADIIPALPGLHPLGGIVSGLCVVAMCIIAVWRGMKAEEE